MVLTIASAGGLPFKSGALPLLVYDILINLSLTDRFLLLNWSPISSWTNVQTSGGGRRLVVLAPPWRKGREVSEVVYLA